MGLFDRIRKDKGGDLERKTALPKKMSNEAILAPNSIECAIAQREVRLDKCDKVPLSDVVALGGAFAMLKPALQQILGAGHVGDGSLVRVVFPDGIKGKLATLKETGEAIGGILTNGGGLAQARLRPVTIEPATTAMIVMASMLVEINQKLDCIIKTQQEILSFLELEKQAGQQADLNLLTDMLNSYKHNWDNTQYRQNHHMKALDIKQTSEKNILFYQEQIARAIKDLPVFYVDQNVRVAVDKLDKLFRNYRTAEYLYAFSAFLEVMLLGNFREAYLAQVSDKVRGYNECYRAQYSQCRDLIVKLSSESVESQIAKGLENISKTLGEAISSVPFLRQGPVDEWLLDGGEKIHKDGALKVEHITSAFSSELYTCADVFVDGIQHIAKVSNHTTDLLFDGTALYLATE